MVSNMCRMFSIFSLYVENMLLAESSNQCFTLPYVLVAVVMLYWLLCGLFYNNPSLDARNNLQILFFIRQPVCNGSPVCSCCMKHFNYVS